MPVAWSGGSLRDLDRIWEFHAAYDRDRADDIERALQDGAARLSLMPHIGRPGTQGAREYSMTDIQYVFAYLIEDDRIVIVRVRSTRERA